MLSILLKVFHWIFPNRCIKCYVEVDNALCLNCWEKLNFINPPYCCQCGVPMKFIELIGMNIDSPYCPNCYKKKQIIGLNNCNINLRAIMKYDDASAKLIFLLKYQGQLRVAKFLAQLAMEKYGKLLNQVDWICPVPLHHWKLIKRNYNQSALIIQQFLILKHKHALNLLKKIKITPNQVGLTYQKRITNLYNAFQVHEDWKEKIRDKKILIIDDVCTTGTTLKTCGQTLLDAGAKQVYGLAMAKVFK